LSSGALVLSLLLRVRNRGVSKPAIAEPDRLAGVALLAYALPYSWAYRHIDAGVGALILFGAVQVPMIGAGLFAGERPGSRGWCGCALALGGLAYLGWPGREAPDLGGSL